MRTIEVILKETALDTNGVNHYGRGVKAYANIESADYPRIWIHSVNPIDEVHINGSVSVSYEVIGEVSSLIEYTTDLANNDDASVEYLSALHNLETIYLRFIGKLNRHPKNKRAIGRVTRREILHEYDDNVIGYVFTFQISVHEAIPYECP